jgi:hypothetical protein
MTCVDRTSVFQDLLADKLKGKQPVHTHKRRREDDALEGAFREKDYMAEAYNIVCMGQNTKLSSGLIVFP